MVKKVWRYVYSFWQKVPTWRTTDRHTPHDGVRRACIASRGKNTSYAPGCQRRAVHTGKLRLHENREKNCHIFAIILFDSAESKDGSTFRANVNRICLKKQILALLRQEALLSQRGRAILRLCQQLASTIQYLECTLLLLVTSASDLPVCTIKFCSVVFGITSKLSVTNKIQWCVAWRRLLITGDGRRISAITYNSPLKCWWRATVQQWSMPKPDIGRKSPFLPQLGRPRRNIAITFRMEKLDWFGCRWWWNWIMIIRFDGIHERDRRTDRHRTTA